MWYFDDSTRVSQLAAALRRWEGTPFAQGCAECQVGVDCVSFVREVLRECGVDVSPAHTIPRYSLAWGIHQQHSQLLGWLHEAPAVRRSMMHIDRSEPMLAGDVIAVRVSAGVHHLCIIDADSPPRVWHVPAPGCVSHFEPCHEFAKRFILRLRLIA